MCNTDSDVPAPGSMSKRIIVKPDELAKAFFIHITGHIPRQAVINEIATRFNIWLEIEYGKRSVYIIPKYSPTGKRLPDAKRLEYMVSPAIFPMFEKFCMEENIRGTNLSMAAIQQARNERRDRILARRSPVVPDPPPPTVMSGTPGGSTGVEGCPSPDADLIPGDPNIQPFLVTWYDEDLGIPQYDMSDD